MQRRASLVHVLVSPSMKLHRLALANITSASPHRYSRDSLFYTDAVLVTLSSSDAFTRFLHVSPSLPLPLSLPFFTGLQRISSLVGAAASALSSWTAKESERHSLSSWSFAIWVCVSLSLSLTLVFSISQRTRLFLPRALFCFCVQVK